MADEAWISNSHHFLHDISNYILTCDSPPSVLTNRRARTIMRLTVQPERGRPFRCRRAADPLRSHYYPQGRNLRLYRYCCDTSLQFIGALPPFAASLLPFCRPLLPFTAFTIMTSKLPRFGGR